MESLGGDIMLLGNSSWKIRRVQATGRVIVEDAHGAAPNDSVLAWRGTGADPGTFRASGDGARESWGIDAARLCRERDLRSSAQALAAVEWLEKECGVGSIGRGTACGTCGGWARGAGSGADANHGDCGAIFRRKRRDATGDPCAVRRADQQGLGTGAAQAILPFVQSGVAGGGDGRWNQYCVVGTAQFSAGGRVPILASGFGREVLEQAVLASPIFTARWRWDASRALVLQRFQGGKKVPPQIQRMRADDLLASVFPDAAACPENLDAQPHDSGPSAGARSNEGCADGSDGRGGAEAGAGTSAERKHPVHCGGYTDTITIFARDFECKSVCVPG